jgi:dUTP pyrophosphatase
MLYALTMKHPLRIRYLRPSARALYEAEGGLAYATPHSAGLDLRACFDDAECVIPAGSRASVPSGIAVEPPAPGVAGFVYSRSGLGAVQGLTVAQGVGVIDPDYRGEILVILLNTSGEERRLRRGERMAQLVFQPIIRAELEVAERLGETKRGAGGFGHTGRI